MVTVAENSHKSSFVFEEKRLLVSNGSKKLTWGFSALLGVMKIKVSGNFLVIVTD